MSSRDNPSQKILHTGLALLSVQGITWLSSFVGVLVMPRFLGPSDFGLLASAGTVVMLMSLLASFGSTNYLVKETARYPGSTRAIALHTVALRIAFWIALSVLVLPPVFLLADSATVKVVMAAALAGGLATLIVEGLFSAFQGNQRLGRISFVLSAFGLVGQGLVVVVVIAGGGVIGVVVAGLASTAAGATLVGILFLATFRDSVRPSVERIRSILRAGPPYLAWDLGLKTYATLDLILLPILVGSAQVGGYAFAYRLVFIPVFVTTIITMAIYPALSAAVGEDKELFRKVVNNAARLSFLATAPMAAGLAVLAVPLVRLLSGDEFTDSALLMVILALHVPPAAVHTVLGTSLFARDLQRKMAAVAWLSVAFNLAGNLVAIPLTQRLFGNGAIGAAGMSVLTEVLVGVFVWRWAWGTVGVPLLASFARCLAATGVMAVATLVACEWGGVFIAVPVGALTYLVCGAVFGVFSLREVNHLRLQFLGASAVASVES